MNMLAVDKDVLAATGVFDRAIRPNRLEGREAPSFGEPAAAKTAEAAAGSNLVKLWEDLSINEPAVSAALRSAIEASGAEIPQNPVADEAPPSAAGPPGRAQGVFDFRLGVRMEMATTPQGLELVMELPGVQQRDIEIEVCGDLLTVRGELRRDNERPDRTYRMSDRSYGKFSRSIDLPKGVRPEQIKAALDSGLLSIFIPNPVSPKSTKIHVQSALTCLTAVGDVLALAIAAPGVGKDDLRIEVAGGMLTIRGRPAPLLFGDTGRPPPQGEALAILCAIELPADVRADQITATLARGVLKVTIPNRPNQAPQRVQVQAA